MYSNCLFLFILSVICGSSAQFYEGDTCMTDTGNVGICKLEHICKYALDMKVEERHIAECGYKENTLIVCCPRNQETGLLSRFFEGTEGVILGKKMTCHYDGYVPMLCCPTINNEQPEEERGCPALPSIPTPMFDNPAHTVAWEKCVANERYVHVCVDPSEPRQDSCHIPDTAERISGGVPAMPWEFPHMAALGCDGGNITDIVWVGGGSLISDRYILTAGHVLMSHAGNVRYALLGSLNKTDIRSGELYGIVKLIPHKQYSFADKYHDIALVLLNRRVTFSEFIRPICLPVPGIDPEDSERLVAGWGGTGVHERASDILLKATIIEVNSDQCSNRLTSRYFSWKEETMICGGSKKSRYGFTDTCKGDSGGPLMYKVTNPAFSCNYIVTGVVSWGQKCSLQIPAVYTKVSAYLDWIVGTVWPNELEQASAVYDEKDYESR